MAGKSVLVIDTPKTCKECQCQMMFVCVPADEDIDEYVDPNTTIPKWCPLRPLPKWKIDGCSAFNERGGIVYDDEVFDLVKELVE